MRAASQPARYAASCGRISSSATFGGRGGAAAAGKSNDREALVRGSAARTACDAAGQDGVG